MEEKLDKILENQALIRADFTALNTRIVGSKKLKQKGLIDEVEKNSSARRKMYKAGGFFAGIILAWESVKAWIEA